MIFGSKDTFFLDFWNQRKRLIFFKRLSDYKATRLFLKIFHRNVNYTTKHKASPK